MKVWLLYALISTYEYGDKSIASFQNEFTTKESCVRVGNELHRKFGAKTLCVEVKK